MKIKRELIAILAVALVLRLINLDQSLWLDEAIEWWAVKSFGLRELLTGYMIGDFNPPGHHVLMWFWVRIFGDSEIALRMPAVIFGVGTIWFVYKISELIFQNSDLAVFASSLVAANGLMIYYSQEARMYAMAAFFAAGAMYFFMKMNKTNKTDKTNGTDYAIYSLFLAAAMYSHYLTWLLLPFLAIWGVRYLAPLLVTIPWWPMLVKQLSAGMAAAGNPVWAELSQTNFKNLALVAVKFVTGRVPWPDGWGQLGVGVIVFGFWMIIFIGVIRVIREIRQIRDPKLMLIFWAFGPLALGAIVGLFVPVFTYFRFLFAAPAVMILAAMGVSELGKLGKFGKLGVLGVMLIFSGWYLLIPGNHREDWKGAVGELHRLDEAPAVIIHPAVRPPFDYYDQRSEVRGQRSVVISSQGLGIRDQGSDTRWYIPYAQAIFDPEDLTRKFLRDEGYVRTFERHFRGVTLERWYSGIATSRPKVGTRNDGIL